MNNDLLSDAARSHLEMGYGVPSHETDIRPVVGTIPAQVTLHEDTRFGLILARASVGDGSALWCASRTTEEAIGRVVATTFLGECSWNALVVSSWQEAVDIYLSFERSQC